MRTTIPLENFGLQMANQQMAKIVQGFTALDVNGQFDGYLLYNSVHSLALVGKDFVSESKSERGNKLLPFENSRQQALRALITLEVFNKSQSNPNSNAKERFVRKFAEARQYQIKGIPEGRKVVDAYYLGLGICFSVVFGLRNMLFYVDKRNEFGLAMGNKEREMGENLLNAYSVIGREINAATAELFPQSQLTKLPENPDGWPSLLYKGYPVIYRRSLVRVKK